MAFVSLAPLLWALRNARPRRGALLGLVFGLVYYGILLAWLQPFGIVAWLPLVVSQAGWVALFGFLLPFLWRDQRSMVSAFAAAALWTSIDWARGTWPVGGFTWGGLGYTQHGNGFLLPLASVAGVWGVTFVVLLMNALLLGAVSRPVGERRPVFRNAVLPIGVAAAFVLAPALIPLPAATGRPLSVAVVQGNVPRAIASDPLLRGDIVERNEIELHRTLGANPPQLVVWPENSLDQDPLVDPAAGQPLAEVVRQVGVPTLVGAIQQAPGGRFYNVSLLYDRSGQVIGRYAKIHLVPFGEYVPFPSVFGWTEQYRRGNVDFSAGHRVTVFHVDGVAVGTPICFENVFPGLFRRFVAAGANLVVVTTNDSSFLTSPASPEHVIFSQLRAVETGRWVVEAAISGQSAVVDPRGRVVARTQEFRRAVLRFDVPTSTSRTIYTRLGDWFPWACGIAALLALALAWRRRPWGSRPEETTATPETPAGTPPAGERSDALGPLPVSGGSIGKVLVVLPTYNERATIERVVEGVLAVAPSIDILVVDDGSPDGTGNLVEKIAEGEPRVRLRRREGKQGLASAYLLGFRTGIEEGYDVLVEMDADLSHRPADLPGLLAGSERYDLTIGSRYIPGGGVSNWSRSRVALSKAGNRYARTALRLPVTDATSGFRAFRRGLLEALLADGIHSEGYGFQIELVYRALRMGFSVGESPITFQEREHGHSKLSRRIVVEALLKVTQWGFQERVRRGRTDAR